MWVRFLKDTDGGAHKGDVVWTKDKAVGTQLIDEGIVAQCLGPAGVAFGEAAPEDVQAVLDAEALEEEQNTILEGGEN